MAKFGQLALDGGLWNGQRIVSSSWIDSSTTPRSNIMFTQPEEWDWQVDGYGYQWWTGYYDVNGVNEAHALARPRFSSGRYTRF